MATKPPTRLLCSEDNTKLQELLVCRRFKSHPADKLAPHNIFFQARSQVLTYIGIVGMDLNPKNIKIAGSHHQI